ncbi:hypothetical protein [Nocardia jejuensis]|uniref:hypothetical protein n=1 Tax=Nocardia jejuensis TaxID=328049 RepID=UPI000B28AA7F|nr:hypothetical protein [Nocardia jejuensis]
MAEQNNGGVDATTLPPNTIRTAGALAAFEGAVGVIGAIVLIVRAMSGADQKVVNGYATAVWLIILAGAVLAAGIALWRGKRWGRAIVMLAQLLLLPVAWYVISSHQALYGIPLGLVAALALGCLFAPASSRWMAEGYDLGDED